MLLPDFKLDTFFLPTDVPLGTTLKAFANEAAEEYARREWLLKEQRRLDEAARRAAAEAQGEDVSAAPEPFEDVDFSQLPDICDWIEENCYDYTSVDPITLDVNNPRYKNQKIVLADYQKEILRHIFPPGGINGNLSKYVTVIWSQVKKSGKTQTAANVGCYVAANVDPPNVVLAIANKKEQAEDRVYRSMKPTIAALGAKVPTSITSKPVMRLPNGTEIRALPNAPATEAGDSYALTLWTEIWAFKSETDERLFSELMPVETRRFSMRWIETYAGYWDESNTLKRLYLKAFKDATEQELAEGARYVPELMHITTAGRPACIEVPEEQLFIFWDHERRMPWHTEQAFKREFKALPKTEAIRLMLNRWQSSSSDLLEEDWIVASHAEVRERWLNEFKGRQFTLAVDAAMRHDSISLVGSFKEGEMYATPFIEIHDPKGQDANLHDLVENRVKALFDEGILESFWDDDAQRYITPVYFDPFQLHQIRLNCIEYGIDVIEFNQGEMRKKADTMLYHLYKDGLIANPSGREDFYEHLRAGKAKYIEGEQLRIQKGTTMDAKRIDALVGQSMSCYGAFLADQKRLTQDDKSSLLILDSTENGWFGVAGELDES